MLEPISEPRPIKRGHYCLIDAAAGSLDALQVLLDGGFSIDRLAAADVLALRPLDASGLAGWEALTSDGERRAYDGVIVENSNPWDACVDDCASSLEATLPFLDAVPVRRRDGVPLRVAGMTLPVGAERLYFIGVGTPREDQPRVHAAQARLIAKFLTAQERTDIALSEHLARTSRAETRIGISRRAWRRDLNRADRRIDRLLQRTTAPSDTSPTIGNPRIYIAFHV